MQPQILDDVHLFWFGPVPDFASFNDDRFSLWFGGGRDAEIAGLFSAALAEADGAAIDVAVLTPSQQTGLVVLLDQFPRSVFRGEARSYSFDEKARGVVKVATAGGMQPFKLVERAFLTICLGHSEHLDDQERALRYYVEDVGPFAPAGNRFYEAGGIQTAKYLDIIRRFGRFPHRNAILGRETSAEEAQFLAENSMAPF
ncbi:MAG: DUF924 domain-containing protein [Bauldia sp.]|nr:DUF924 domain-containing protein [Bauldia sp.]